MCETTKMALTFNKKSSFGDYFSLFCDRSPDFVCIFYTYTMFNTVVFIIHAALNGIPTP